MVIKFNAHFINNLLTIRTQKLFKHISKIEAYKQNNIFHLNFIHIFNNVNKYLILQYKFKNVKIAQYDLNNK